MGTPAFIGIRHNNGQITGIHCHHGHIEHLAPILFEHYHDQSKIEELLDLGNLSSVGPEPDHIVGPEPDHIRTVSYIRDWNRSPYKEVKVLYRSMVNLREKCQNLYSYFVFENCEWNISIDCRWFHPLRDALEQMGIKP